MTNNIQSIEDLIAASAGAPVDEKSVEGKFAKKQHDMYLKDQERLTKGNAASLGIQYVNLFGFPISQDALALVDEITARDLKAVCFFYDGERIYLATTEIRQEVYDLLEELKAKFFVNGEVYLITENSLEYALKLYANLPKIMKIINGVEITKDDLAKFDDAAKDYRELSKIINLVNISDVVTLILATAMKTRSSDVHIEAEEKGIIIRLRIDGVLQEAAVVDRDKWKKIISRMKLLARVKLNIEGKPQDGRFTIFLDDDKIDVRASFLPTSFGESVVMRLLRSESVSLQFEELGLRPEAFAVLEREIKKPNGMILTTGPTGSGKTTTLYSILNKLNQPEVKIITLENPIEYQLKGVNQSQVDESKGYNFSQGLRSILRQDPDVVMVGEIRDLETAEIAIQASLTGHLVLSTLHTNDAAGVIPRLVDMGVKPFFLAPSINAVIGQRLVRKLCQHCKVEHVLSKGEEKQVKKILAVISSKSQINVPTVLPMFYQASEHGCEHCSGIGYKGRVGIYEIFTMSEELRMMASQGKTEFEILKQAVEDGMITMLQDGVLKSIEGQTSLAEIYRVIGKFDYIDALYDVVVSKVLGYGIEIEEETIAMGRKLSGRFEAIHGHIQEMQTNELFPFVMSLAISQEAGDVHIEPADQEAIVRFRVDGVMQDVAKISKEHYTQLLSKIKSSAGIPTNVKKATWDARFTLLYGAERTDCRLSIISGGYGETIVIRLLLTQASDLQMENLGLRNQALATIVAAISKTKGIVITTGPTGSGKTTTLYSVLNKLNNPGNKIITIEDPIEYHLDGIMQTQIDTAGGYTFSAALRSLMRQNPNVIMIGEIRDDETAKAAIEAAMTGHLVLSTIHANSAAGAVPRFVGLAVDRQMLAASLSCSVGQRLPRRICKFCKEEISLLPEELEKVHKYLDEIRHIPDIMIPAELRFYRGKGCDKCGHSGYKGRIGIYEAIEITPEMQKLIQAPLATDYDIEREAIKNGSILTVHDGILKALDGETTVEEVFRVV